MNEKIKYIIGIIVVIVLSYAVGLLLDEGEYDYCVAWEGLNGGTLNRDNMIPNCFSLATGTFKCDYDIDENTGVLQVKPILDITYDKVGVITSITYDQSNYFNCTRWLKSKR